jgi:antitoxin HicB
MNKYSINIMWSDEDGGYIATIPEFPGLSAFGENPEEAIEEAKIALEGFLEVYNEDGCKIPEPQTLECYSGQTRLRLPKTLHAKLSQQAQREGVSLNTYLVQLLSEGHVKNQVGIQLNEIKQLALLKTTHPKRRSQNSYDLFRPLVKSTWSTKEDTKIRVH